MFQLIQHLTISEWIILLFGYHKSENEIKEEYSILKKSLSNPEAFGVIYEGYYDEIFGFIYKRTLDEELTSDLTANVFYAALFNLRKFKFKGLPFSSWLYRIALNSISMHYRKEKTKEKYVSAEKNQLHNLVDEIHFELKEEKIEYIVNNLLGKLKENELQIIEMRFFENMSYREIGEVLGLSETNTKTKTFRIIKKLRKIVNG